MTQHPPDRKTRGFTLIEVIMALGIVASALALLATSTSSNVSRIQKIEMIHRATSLLEKKMLEYEALYRDRPLAEIPEEESGEFDGNMKGYRWTFQSRELTMPDLSALLIGQGGAEETLLLMVRKLSEYMQKSVKEGKVSIFVKGNRKTKEGKVIEREFSLTTYFIDHNANVPLGLGDQ